MSGTSAIVRIGVSTALVAGGWFMGYVVAQATISVGPFFHYLAMVATSAGLLVAALALRASLAQFVFGAMMTVFLAQGFSALWWAPETIRGGPEHATLMLAAFAGVGVGMLCRTERLRGLLVRSSALPRS